MNIKEKSESSHKLDVFVLTRDRPEFLGECLGTLYECFETMGSIRLIVSDNSVTLSLRNKNLVESRFPGCIYRRRDTAVSIWEHVRIIATEVEADFFCMLHDDDLYDKNFLRETLEELESDPLLIAVGTNGRAIDIAGKTLSPFFRGGRFAFRSPADLLARYYSMLGTAVWSSYVYRKATINHELLDGLGACGNHSDVQFLLSLYNGGGYIKWLDKKLVYYRIHPLQENAKSNIDDRRKLVDFYKDSTNGLPEMSQLSKLYVFDSLLSERELLSDKMALFLINLPTGVRYFSVRLRRYLKKVLFP